MSAEIGFGLATLGVLLLAYLWFNHIPSRTIYYTEAHPVLMLVTALGLWRVLHWCSGKREQHDGSTEFARRGAPDGRVAAMALVLVVFLANFAREVVSDARHAARERESYQMAFQDKIARIPEAKAVVFVRYGPAHNPDLSLIYNEPDLEAARRWIVYDRGADNLRLMQVAPDRAAYLYDDAHNALRPFVAARDTVSAETAGR